jgi:hypothetical protein
MMMSGRLFQGDDLSPISLLGEPSESADLLLIY